MRRIAAVLAAAVLLVMCCPAAMAADREYTVEELGMTFTLPEEYHVFSTQTMNDSFWLDYIDDPVAHMQQIKEDGYYLQAYTADFSVHITITAEATAATDFRDLENPEAYLLNPTNIVLNDVPETTISREVITAAQTPFLAERFSDRQENNRDTMACLTVMNGMQYLVLMLPLGGDELTEAQVQTLRSMVESIQFTGIPEQIPETDTDAQEYTVEELGMTLRLPEEYHVFSTQTMYDPYWQDSDEPLWQDAGDPAAYMQQVKENDVYLLAADADSRTFITVAAMATTDIDYRDLLEPETCLLDPENNILHDESEATISREVISTTQTPFYVERFWNDQMDNREAMACVTVVNGMQYGITMQPFGGTELATAQVQAFRSSVESVWFTDLPELKPVPLTQEYRIEELGMTIMLPEQYHVITSQGISDETLTLQLDDPAAFMQELMDAGIFMAAYAPDYSSVVMAAVAAADLEDFRTQLDRTLMGPENDLTALGFHNIRSRELIKTPQVLFLAVRSESEEDGTDELSGIAVMDGVCFTVMASPAAGVPLTKSQTQIFSDMIESIRLDDLRDVIRPSDTVVLALEIAILVLLLPVAALIYRLLIKKRPISRKRTVLVVLLQGAITGGAFALARLVIPNIVQEPLFGSASFVCMAAAFVIYSEGYRAPEKEQPQPEEV